MTDLTKAGGIKKSLRERFRFVELLLYWEGGINTSQLTNQFNIGRQQASKDIGDYQRLTGNKLEYSAVKKLYSPIGAMELAFTQGVADEYLWFASGISHSPHDQARIVGFIVNPPLRKISKDLVQVLVAAQRYQKCLEVDYRSLTNPSADGRLIWPQRFVYTCGRWHVRAWCERSQSYRDFVMARFFGTPSIEDSTAMNLPADVAWNTEVLLVVKPDPRLTFDQAQILQREYGMKNGELHVYTKAALARYTLDDLRVNYKVLDGNPTAQQLVLANYPEIRQWLF